MKFGIKFILKTKAKTQLRATAQKQTSKPRVRCQSNRFYPE